MPALANKYEELDALKEERDTIAGLISEQFAVLESKKVTWDESLVDGDGFPRADVDVHGIRSCKNSIIRFQNDYKNTMKKIELCIQNIFNEKQRQEEAGEEEVSNNINGSSETVQIEKANESVAPVATATSSFTPSTIVEPPQVGGNPINNKAIVKVTAVNTDGPAYASGILSGDLIIKLGHLDKTNFKTLGDIANLLKENENKAIEIVLQRKESEFNVNFTPKQWSGRGLFGCHVVAI